MSSYYWITLVERNVNCANISESEFAQMMFSDMLEAEEKYNELYIPEHVKSIFDNFEYTIRSAKRRATAYAEKKWKTEKKRNEYIMKEMTKAREGFNFNKFYYDLSFFDFDVNPGTMGISGNCILDYKNLTYNKLISCFNSIKDNKYFKQARGWKLTYQASENSYRVAFRPQIQLIVSDEVQAQMDKEEADLTASVTKFYEGCRYWGD